MYYWNNPYSNVREPIEVVCNEVFGKKENRKLPPLVIWQTEDMALRSLHGLWLAYRKGDPKALQRLPFQLLDQLDEPHGFCMRSVTAAHLDKRGELGSRDECKEPPKETMNEIDSYIKIAPENNVEAELWNLYFNYLVPARLRENFEVSIDNILGGAIVDAYIESFPGVVTELDSFEKWAHQCQGIWLKGNEERRTRRIGIGKNNAATDRGARLRRFRERLQRIPELKDKVLLETLRYQAILARGYFFSDIAKSYFDAVQKRYLNGSGDVFRLLNFPYQRPKGLDCDLTSLPPIAAYPALVSLIRVYTEMTSRDFFYDIRDGASLGKGKSKNNDDDYSYSELMRTLHGIGSWYYFCFPCVAKENDQHRVFRPVISSLETDIWADRLRIVESKYQDRVSFIDAISVNCSKKQAAALTILINLESKSSVIVGREMGISQQAAHKLLGNACEKMQAGSN